MFSNEGMFKETESLVDLGRTGGKVKKVLLTMPSFYSFNNSAFDHSKLDSFPFQKGQIILPSEMGLTKIVNPPPFYGLTYRSKEEKDDVSFLATNDRIFKGDVSKWNNLMVKLKEAYVQIEELVDHAHYGKSAKFSLKEIKSIIYLPGVSVSHHQMMLNDSSSPEFPFPSLDKLEDFFFSTVRASMDKNGDKFPKSLKRHTNTGGPIPVSGMDVDLNSLALFVQANYGLQDGLAGILDKHEYVKQQQRNLGYDDVGVLRLPGFRYQHNASPRMKVSLVPQGARVDEVGFGIPKKRIIGFGGKDTESAAKSDINRNLYALKGTFFVSTDPEVTRLEQQVVLKNNPASKVVSIDFDAFDSTIRLNAHKWIIKMYSKYNLIPDGFEDLWEYEASLPAMSAPVHKGDESIFIDNNPMAKLDSGRFDTSVTGITIGSYLGLYAIFMTQYSGDEGKFQRFADDANKMWHVADYGDDLQITFEGDFDSLNDVLTEYGFSISEEPTTSHLKKVIDHDRGVVHNSFFSMFKNLIGPERPKVDKMTFALGIKSRSDLASKDPLLELPLVKQIFQDVLDYQGDFRDVGHIEEYLNSEEFKTDMDAYVKSAVKRSQELSSIIAAATLGTYQREDLSPDLQKILGQTDFDLINPSFKIDDLKTVGKEKIQKVFELLHNYVHYGDPSGTKVTLGNNNAFNPILRNQVIQQSFEILGIENESLLFGN